MRSSTVAPSGELDPAAAAFRGGDVAGGIFGMTVLYDGACPLCRREIGVYRSLRANVPVCFADVSDAALPLPPGITREQLMARFHVRGGDCQLLSGAQAFLALWAVLPGWRWLALAGRLPGAAWVMERTYCLFLCWRPVLQRWAARLDRPGAAQPHSHHNAPPFGTHSMTAIALITGASGGIGRALGRDAGRLAEVEAADLLHPPAVSGS